MINGKIGDREIRLIGSQGEQIGVMNSKEALRMAREEELDLVLIAPNANPPVCKIIDYGKYRYEMARKEKEAKKKQKVIEIKEVRLSPNIDENDVNTKAKAARKFLEKGDKVKVSLRFRGREMSHMNQSRHILDDFAEKLSDIAVIDKPAKVEGRSLVMFLSEKIKENELKEDMKMPKLKTKRAAAKRFKKTGTGQLKRMKAYKSHILTKKSQKRKRNLRKATITDATNAKVMKKILPY